MVGTGFETQLGQNPSSDGRTFDSDVLARAEQRVSGNNQQRRSDVISDWLFPANKEERQLGQQMALMSAEPSIKMNAMKAAGINPYTAASGIAGSGTSTPQPASSTNPIGDVAGAVGDVAGAFNSVAGGVSALSKLGDEIENIRSDSKAKLAAAGLDEVNTEAVLTDNKYRGENWEADLNIKRQQFSNMKQELSNMKATHREIMTHCDEMISQIELNGSQKDYYDAMQLRVQEDLRWQKALNDWCLANNLMIRDSGVDGYLFNMLYNDAPDGDVDAFFNSYYDYCKKRSYAISRGQYSAESEFAYQISYARKNGDNASDVLYGRIGSPADLAGRIASLGTNLWNGAFNGVVSNVKELFKIRDAKKLRSELTTVLNNAYDQLDKYPDDSKRLNAIITDLQFALQLSNKELLEWSSKNWSSE